MENYVGTKRIRAEAMTRLAYNELRGWELPSNENGDDPGYLVEYIEGGAQNVKGYEGYVSWSPKDVFEKAYQPTTAMSFGPALELIKAGRKVARAGWNGKDMFVYYVPTNSYKATTPIARAVFGDTVPYRAYLALRTADGDVATWVPSSTDVLADDWMEV